MWVAQIKLGLFNSINNRMHDFAINVTITVGGMVKLEFRQLDKQVNGKFYSTENMWR